MAQNGAQETLEGVFSAAWRPAGAMYLLFCVAGLAAGLWPDAIFVRRASPPAPLPALQTLVVAQIAYGLVVWPLFALRRAGVGRMSRYWRGAVVENLAYLLVAAPFYAAAAYFADAVAMDVLRAAIYVACVWTLSVAAGAHVARGGRGRSIAAVALAVAAFGLPAAHYIALEFFTPVSARIMGWLSPATFAWAVSASRGASWYPRPLWAALIWPAAAAIAGCLHAALHALRDNRPPKA